MASKRKNTKGSLFRTLKVNFWKDPKIVEDFSKENTLFYLYFLTSPYSSLCGCYEVTKKQICLDTKSSFEEVENQLQELTNLGVLKYSNTTKELLLLNFQKHNWTGSKDYLTGVLNEMSSIKEKKFLIYLMNCFLQLEFIDPESDTGISILNAVRGSTQGVDTVCNISNDELSTMLNSIRNSIKNEEKSNRKEKDSAQNDQWIKNLSTQGLSAISMKNELDVNQLISFYDHLKNNDFILNKTGEKIYSEDSLVKAYNDNYGGRYGY